MKRPLDHIAMLLGMLAGTAAAGADEQPTSRPAGIDPDPPYHGVAIQLHSTKDPIAVYGRLVHEVADLGADTVMLSANGYQEDVDSIVIEVSASGMPSPAQWLELFGIARGRGLRIVLMPKILLSDPREGAWRGKIAPVSWDAWFDQYRQFVLHYAELAQRGGVEVLMIGSELVTTEKHTEQWREIIRQVRGVYAGRLAYSANWDHYKGIQFWQDLDLIGLTTYYDLNEDDKAKPTAEDLAKAWKPISRNVLAWREKVDRPLLFTEAGWCSQEGASTEPWNYYHNEEATPAGHQEQAANYQAFIETWAGRPEVGGILWWEWTASAGGDKDHSYTPKGKPAEAVLREYFRRRQSPDGSGGDRN